MSRRIAIRTKSEVRFYDIKTMDRPVTIIGQHLYRTDEEFMIASNTEPAEFCLYDIDSPYPYCSEVPPATDETMAYLDIIKASSNNKIRKAGGWPKWLTWNTMVFGLLGVVVVYYIFTRVI